MDYELQLTAMKAVMEALKPLDDAGRKAVVGWVNGQLGIAPPPSAGAAPTGPSPAGVPARAGTVSVVSQKLGVTSARDLLLAAAAHLTLYQGKESFSKDELVACAKEARSWKASYTNQMASNIKRMCSAETLFEKARDVFSLSDAAIADVEGRLAR